MVLLLSLSPVQGCPRPDSLYELTEGAETTFYILSIGSISWSEVHDEMRDVRRAVHHVILMFPAVNLLFRKR